MDKFYKDTPSLNHRILKGIAMEIHKTEISSHVGLTLPSVDCPIQTSAVAAARDVGVAPCEIVDDSVQGTLISTQEVRYGDDSAMILDYLCLGDIKSHQINMNTQPNNIYSPGGSCSAGNPTLSDAESGAWTTEAPKDVCVEKSKKEFKKMIRDMRRKALRENKQKPRAELEVEEDIKKELDLADAMEQLNGNTVNSMTKPATDSDDEFFFGPAEPSAAITATIAEMKEKLRTGEYKLPVPEQKWKRPKPVYSKKGGRSSFLKGVNPLGIKVEQCTYRRKFQDEQAQDMYDHPADKTLKLYMRRISGLEKTSKPMPKFPYTKDNMKGWKNWSNEVYFDHYSVAEIGQLHYHARGKRNGENFGEIGGRMRMNLKLHRPMKQKDFTLANDMAGHYEWQEKLHKRAHHHPDGVGGCGGTYNERLLGTIECLCDLWCCAMADTDSYHTAYDAFAKWLYVYENGQIAGLQPKFKKLEKLGIFMFYCGVNKYGVTDHKFGGFKKARENRNKPLSLEAQQFNWQEAMESPSVPFAFKYIPEQNDYMYETLLHCNMVDNMMRFFVPTFGGHDSTKFFERSMIAYTWRWYVSGKAIRPTMLASGFKRVANSAADLLKTIKESISKTAVETVTGMETSEIEEAGEKIADQVDGIGDMIRVSADKIKTLIAPTLHMFGVAKDNADSISTTIYLTQLYVLYINTTNSALKGLIFVKALSYLGILSRVTKHFEVFMMQANADDIKEINEETAKEIKAAQEAETGKDEIPKTSITSTIFDFLSSLYNGLKTHTVGILAVAASFLVCILTGKFYKAGKFKDMASKLNDILINSGFVGRAVMNITGMLTIFKTLFSSVQDWIRVEFFGEKPEGIDDAIVTDFRVWYARCCTLTDTFTMEDYNKHETYRVMVMTAYKEMGNFEAIFANNRAYDRYNSMLRDKKRALVDVYKSVCRMMRQPTFRKVPLHVCFMGAAGIGKSTLLESVLEHVANKHFDGENSSYCRTANDKYWDGYNGQNCVIYDDLGPTNDFEHFGELLTIISHVVVMLQKAHLEEKGMPFESDFLFSTTNNPWPDVRGAFSLNALWRRYHMLFKPVLSDPAKNVFDKKGFNEELFKKHYPGQNSKEYPHVKFEKYDPMIKETKIGTYTWQEMLDQIDIEYAKKQASTYGTSSADKRKAHEKCKQLMKELKVFAKKHPGEHVQLFNFLDLFDKREDEVDPDVGTADIVSDEEPVINLDLDATALKYLRALSKGEPGAFQVYLESFLGILPLGIKHAATPENQELLKLFETAGRIINGTKTVYNSSTMTIKQAFTQELVREYILAQKATTEDWTTDQCNKFEEMMEFMGLLSDKDYKDLDFVRQIKETMKAEDLKLRAEVQQNEIAVNVLIDELKGKVSEFTGYESELWEKYDKSVGVLQKFKIIPEIEKYLNSFELVESPDAMGYSPVPIIFKKLLAALTTYKLNYLLLTHKQDTHEDVGDEPKTSKGPKPTDLGSFMPGDTILQKNCVDDEMVLSEKLSTEYFLYFSRGERLSSRCGWQMSMKHGLPTANEIQMFGRKANGGWDGKYGPFYDRGRCFSQYFLAHLSKVRIGGKLYWSVRKCPYKEEVPVNVGETESERYGTCHVKFGNGEEYGWHDQLRSDIQFFMSLKEEDRNTVFAASAKYRKEGRAIFRKKLILQQMDLQLESVFGKIWGLGKWVWEKIGWFQGPLISLVLTCGAIGVLTAIGKLFNPRIKETSSIFKGAKVGFMHNTSGTMINASIIANIRKCAIGVNKVTGLMIRNHMLLVPEHAVFSYRENKRLDKIPITIFYGDNSLHQFQVEKENCIRIEGADLCLIHKPAVGTAKDIIAYFMKEEDLKSEKGTYVTLVNKEFHGDTASPVLTHLEYSGSSYQCQLGNQINCKAFAYAHAFRYSAKDGESGSPVLNWLPGGLGGKRVIMGFQWGTQGGISYCSSIPQEELFKLVDGLTRSNGFRFEDPIYLEGDENSPIRTTAEVLNPIGKAPAQYVTTDNINTSYITTPLYDCRKSDRMPSITSKHSKYAAAEHPWQYSVNKHGRGLIVDKDSELFEEAVVELADHFKRKIGKLRTLSLRETIEGNENLAHIPLNTSPGIPWIFEKGNIPGKRKFIQLDELGHASWVPEVEDRHGQWMTLLRNKVVPGSIRYTIGKDELRPITKALGVSEEVAKNFRLGDDIPDEPDRVVNTRTIECGPLDETICYRKLNGDLVGKLMALSDGTSMYCPGINIHSMAATNMYMKCLSLNTKGVDMDVKNWDSHQTTQNAEFVAKFNNLCYGDDPESPNGKARQTLELMAIQGYVQFGSDIFFKQLGECSGFPGTTHANTISHILLSIVQWKLSCLEQGRPDLADLATMIKHVANFIYGDDRFVVVSQFIESLGIYTPDFLQRDYLSRGYPVTPADKSNQIKLVDLLQLQFLKCNFIQDEKLTHIYHLGLEEKVCYDLVCFLKNKKHPLSQFAENVQFACEYMVARGEKSYNAFRKFVVDGIKNTDFRGIDVPHHHNMHRVIIQRVLGVGISSEIGTTRFLH